MLAGMAIMLWDTELSLVLDVASRAIISAARFGRPLRRGCVAGRVSGGRLVDVKPSQVARGLRSKRASRALRCPPAPALLVGARLCTRTGVRDSDRERDG